MNASANELDLVFQPELSSPYRDWGFRLVVQDGEIREVFGLGGITQPEDCVPLLQEDPQVLEWRNFRWMRYTLGRVRLKIAEGGRIRIAGTGHETVLRRTDFGEKALRVPVGGKGAILVALYRGSRAGEFRIDPAKVEAGSTQRFDIRFTVGPEGIAEGGAVRLFTPYSSWSSPALSKNDVRFETGGSAQPAALLRPYAHPVFGSVYDIRVANGDLRPGDVVYLRYHGPGDAGIRVQTYSKPSVRFPAFVDATGDGLFLPLPQEKGPAVEVISGPAARLRLAMPMIVRPGERATARIRLLDQEYNPVAERGRTPPVRLVMRRENGETTTISDSGHGDPLRFEDLRFADEGLYEVVASADGLESAAIVVRCAADTSAPRLCWGAIHGHTSISDGEFDPETYYRYGREIGLVDFCAVTDHDWEIVEHDRSRRLGGFRHLQELAAEWNDPGRFVTFAAYEWMGPDGHVNAYYVNHRTDNPIYVGSVSIRNRSDAPTLADLLDRYRDRDDVLLIPHTSHGQRWETYDERLMPVVEMYSCWGCSEFEALGPIGFGMQEGLRRGYRFGLIGGADSHHGSPGHTGRPSKYHVLPHREGFAAVYSRELTRSSIAEALRARRCYATTAERILLETEINGYPMGSILRPPPGSAIEIRILAGGTRPVREIELIRDGEIVERATGSGRIARAAWTRRAEPGRHYYYVRVTQQDGERAWSSPHYIESADGAV